MGTWRDRERGEPREPADERILTGRDVEWALSRVRAVEDPLREYPALRTLLHSREGRLTRRLRKLGVSPEEAAGITRDATRMAAVAALAMHRAIWRDIMPRPGVSGQIWSQLPLDHPPEDDRSGLHDIPF